MSGRRARAQSLRSAGSNPMGLVPTGLGRRTMAVLKPVHSSHSKRRTIAVSSVCSAGPSRDQDGRHQSSSPAALPRGYTERASSISLSCRGRLGGRGRVSCGGRTCSLHNFHQGSETVAMASVPPCGMMPTEGSSAQVLLRSHP
eukprot:6383766-Amphidinium_carterae.2